MENNPDNIKSSSRRRFSASIMAAIVALPFWRFLAIGQTGKSKKKVQARILTHDTPPPLTIEDGSLEIHTTNQLALVENSAPYRYRSNFGGTRNLSHIRILNRKGVELHYEPRAKGSTLKVQLRNEDGSMTDELTITGGSAIQISSRDLKLNEHGNNKPHAFRKYKCDHPGRGANRFRISRIELLDAPRYFLKEATSPTNHPEYFSEEYRILIWFEA